MRWKLKARRPRHTKSCRRWQRRAGASALRLGDHKARLVSKSAAPRESLTSHPLGTAVSSGHVLKELSGRPLNHFKSHHFDSKFEACLSRSLTRRVMLHSTTGVTPFESRPVRILCPQQLRPSHEPGSDPGDVHGISTPGS